METMRKKKAFCVLLLVCAGSAASLSTSRHLGLTYGKGQRGLFCFENHRAAGLHAVRKENEK
jgi:hypothetical protein